MFSVFIGLENINPDNLKEAKKRQNRITEYRAMLRAWKRAGVVTFAGYILGFPGDTPESIRRDIRIIQRELPIDFLEFFILTPLPGSEDHRKLCDLGAAMDPDMNKYDLNHVTADHPRMPRDELQRIWWEAWRLYYTRAHLATIIRRACASGIRARNILIPIAWFWTSIFISRLHPLEGGYLRKRTRLERRAGFPIERPATFYLRYGRELVLGHLKLLAFVAWLLPMALRARLDQAHRAYSDRSLAETLDDDLDGLDLFKISDAAKAATAKQAQRAHQRAARVG